MKIAVLIPTRNSADTLSRAIESVVNQTFFDKPEVDFDIYVVDNMSDDNTKEVVDSYFRVCSIVYLKCEKLGVAHALNAGIDEILKDDAVEFIFRLDADDTWRPEKVEKQMVIFQYIPQAGIVGTGMDFVNKDQASIFGVIYPELHHEIHAALCQNRNPMGHPSVAFRRSVFEEDRYDQTYVGAEDLDLWMRLIKKVMFYNIPEFLVDYYYDPTKDNSTGEKSAATLYKEFNV